MKRSHRVAAAVAAALSIGVGAAAFAHPGGMGGGMGPGAMPEKMRNASTPEERQKLAKAHRDEMQKRAKERGITLPEPRGPRAGAAPESEKHTH